MPAWKPEVAHPNGKTVSSFAIIKGALIPETYAAFAAWNLDAPLRENMATLERTNPLGARSAAWLRDVLKVLHTRFDLDGSDHPLVLLAKTGCDLEVWKPLLLWHMTRHEFLVRDFLVHWLYPSCAEGAWRLRPGDMHEFLRSIEKRGGKILRSWTESTVDRVATSLLKMAVDFGLMTGVASKQFASYHLPEPSFLYLLHAVAEKEPNARRVVESPEWRMYLMGPEDVERELLRLHQFRKLEYQVAGSLGQLRLPCASVADFAVKGMP